MAKDIIDQLLEFGEVRRGMLGISAQPLTPDLVKRFKVKKNYGVIVVEIEPDLRRRKPGLELGDIITSIDGNQVKTVANVINRLGLVRLGDEISMGVLRNNEEMVINATVGLIGEISPLLMGTTFENAETSRGRGYVVIAAVEPGSKLDRLGLQAGDIVLSVNRKRVDSTADMRKIAGIDSERLLLLIQRGQRTEYIEVE